MRASRTRSPRRTASFRDAEVFLLDEFGGVPADAEGRCDVMLRRALFDHVDLPAGRYHRPIPEADDVEAMCAAYDAAIDDAPRSDAARDRAPTDTSA